MQSLMWKTTTLANQSSHIFNRERNGGEKHKAWKLRDDILFEADSTTEKERELFFSESQFSKIWEEKSLC